MARIVDSEPFPDLARLDPHRGVVARIVAGRPPEDFDADGPLLEHVPMPLQRILHNVAQEILAALAGSELMTGENAVQLLANLFIVPVCRLRAVRRLRHQANPNLMIPDPILTQADLFDRRSERHVTSGQPL
jgi:hypothetical protein